VRTRAPVGRRGWVGPIIAATVLVATALIVTTNVLVDLV
jgi:hypothetical protein